MQKRVRILTINHTHLHRRCHMCMCGCKICIPTHILAKYDEVIKSKHFARCWPFVRGIHQPPMDSPHKGQWRRALMFPLIGAWTNGWENNRDAGDMRCHRAHYDVTLMIFFIRQDHGKLIVITVTYYNTIGGHPVSRKPKPIHYNDVVMGAIASQITSLASIYSAV